MAERAEHTPGPWKLEAGRCIATESGSFSIHSNDDWNRNWVELDANARLIAAAPGLLAALKVAAGELKDAREYVEQATTDGQHNAGRWFAAEKEARAAIEAAEPGPCKSKEHGHTMENTRANCKHRQ